MIVKIKYQHDENGSKILSSLVENVVEEMSNNSIKFNHLSEKGLVLLTTHIFNSISNTQDYNIFRDEYRTFAYDEVQHQEKLNQLFDMNIRKMYQQMGNYDTEEVIPMIRNAFIKHIKEISIQQEKNPPIFKSEELNSKVVVNNKKTTKKVK